MTVDKPESVTHYCNMPTRTARIHLELPSGSEVATAQTDDGDIVYVLIEAHIKDGPGLAKSIPPPSYRVIEESA